MITSPNQRPESSSRGDITRDDLTHSPPQPPAKIAKAEHEGMMGTDPEPPDTGTGLGGGISYSTALEGVGQMLMGAQKLSSILPGSVPPPIMQFLEALKSTVPQALQDLATSGGSGGSGMMSATLPPGEQAAQSALGAMQPQQQAGGMPPGGMPPQMGPPMNGPPPQQQQAPQQQQQLDPQMLASLLGGMGQ